MRKGTKMLIGSWTDLVVALAAILACSAVAADEPGPIPDSGGQSLIVSQIVYPGSDSPRLPASIATYVDDVIDLINQARWDNGMLPPLKRVDLLDTSAGTHTSNMAVRNFHMHCDPDTGTSVLDRMIAAGYNPNGAGENIAAGFTTPADVMAAWMGSTFHRANILSTSYREMGVGYVYDENDQGNVRESATGGCPATVFDSGPYLHYWTQNFGVRSIVYPVIINREALSTASRFVDLYLYGTGWASEMRIRNENGSWTDWEAFASDVAWELSQGVGTKTVYVEIRQGATVRAANDSIVSNDVYGDPLIFSDDFETGDMSKWTPVQS